MMQHLNAASGAEGVSPWLGQRGAAMTEKGGRVMELRLTHLVATPAPGGQEAGR